MPKVKSRDREEVSKLIEKMGYVPWGKEMRLPWAGARNIQVRYEIVTVFPKRRGPFRHFKILFQAEEVIAPAVSWSRSKYSGAGWQQRMADDIVLLMKWTDPNLSLAEELSLHDKIEPRVPEKHR